MWIIIGLIAFGFNTEVLHPLQQGGVGVLGEHHGGMGREVGQALGRHLFQGVAQGVKAFILANSDEFANCSYEQMDLLVEKAEENAGNSDKHS